MIIIKKNAVILLSYLLTIIFIQNNIYSETPEDIYQTSIELFNLNLYRHSGFYLQNLLYDYPDYQNSDRASYYLARAYQKIGDLDGSIKTYHNTLIKYPDSSYNSSNWMSLGEVYYYQGQYKRSLNAFLMVEATALNSKDTYNSLVAQSIVLSELDQTNEAIEKIKMVIENSEKDEIYSENLYRLANLYLKDSKKEEAIDTLKRINIDFIDSRLGIFVDFLLASIYFSKNDYEKVIKIASVSDDISSDIKTKIYKMAYLAGYKINDYDTAIEYINKIIDLNKSDNSNSQEDNYDLYFKLGYLYYLKADYKKAILYLDKIRENAKDLNISINVLYLQGIIFLEDGEFAKSFDLFQEVSKLSKNDKLVEEALYNSAVALYKNQDYNTSIEYFNEYISRGEIYKKLIYSMFMIGECYYKQYKYKEAINSYNKLIDIYPSSEITSNAELRIADSYFNLKDYENAIKEYTDYINRYPESEFIPRALWFLAQVYDKNGNSDKTEETYKKIFLEYSDSVYGDLSFIEFIKLKFYKKEFKDVIENINNYGYWFSKDNTYSQMLWIKGISQYNLKKYNNARNTFDEIITNYPDVDEYQNALYYKYLVDYHLGIYTSPLNASEKFINDNPDVEITADIAMKIAQYYFDGKEYTKAREYLLKIVSSKDKKLREKATKLLEKIYTATGNLEKLPELYLEFIDRTQDNSLKAKYILLTAEAYEDIHDYENAINYYQKYIEDTEKHTDHDEALFRLGTLYKKIGLYNNSIVILENFRNSYLKSIYRYPALLNLAYSYQNIGNLVDAIEIHKMVLESNDRSLLVQSFYWLGECYYHLGKRNDAKSWLKRLIKTFPEKTEWINKSRELISRIEKYE
jgi:tetratricopeptide (TPR) repeat protein